MRATVAAFSFDIEKGQSDGVDLSGTRVALAADWPGNFFHGNGTGRLYLDARWFSGAVL